MSLTFVEGGLFGGRYRVVRGIATGAMGAVYEVEHIETERRRALKVMHPHLAENPDFRARFKLEARIAARIASDHIVEVFDAGIDAETGMPFLVMELLRGEELSKRLRRTGRLSAEEAMVYLRQTAIALDKTHAAGVVHRDLKPANLFLAEDEDGGEPRVKVLDFGIAKLVAETALDAATTATLGTPLYMAPEQFRGAQISPAVDIFALGMIAYTLLVGSAYWLNDMREFNNTLAFAVTAMHGPQEPACARAAADGVTLPPAFDPWFAKTTALAPEERFKTASAAIEALAEIFGIAPPPVRSSRVFQLEQPGGAGSIVPVSLRPEPAPAATATAAQSSSTGLETRIAPPKPRSRAAIIAAGLALLGGVAAASISAFLGERLPAGPDGAEATRTEASQAAEPAPSPAPSPAPEPAPEPAGIEPIPAHPGTGEPDPRVVPTAPAAAAPSSDGGRTLAGGPASASAKAPAALASATAPAVSASAADPAASASATDPAASASAADPAASASATDPAASASAAASAPPSTAAEPPAAAEPTRSREWLYTPD
ncbi:protein kinase [Sorangium cellulosum]|uniref:Protein kinase n=1 Tax=Sorangium cellulosum TaxID=56 RepID=A0A2L0F2T3_SORCE|nr:serine/threonine-protein kinase [Sorangium cellulosum]AUX45843.1 protein kinase [Sorangium cellulosum]